MLKNHLAKVYYTAYLFSTCEPFDDDPSNHTVKYCADGGSSLTDITSEISIHELGNSGLYWFELDARYTDVDTAVISVTSSNELGVFIPMIYLSFVPGFSVSDISSINDLSATLTTIDDKVSTIFTKFSAYPVGGSIPTKTDVSNVVTSILTTDVSTTGTVHPYSLGSLICSSFSSTLVKSDNRWVITNPSGGVITTLEFETDEDLKPISTIKPVS